MKKLSLAAFLFVTILALPTWAQTPATKPPVSMSIRASGDAAKSEVKPYQPYQRQNLDAQSMVQQKAEYRANQRMLRVASMQWFGLSNARPQVTPDPVDDEYAPRWVSNDSMFPQRWHQARSTVVVVPATVTR
jgi:hypothetical protein